MQILETMSAMGHEQVMFCQDPVSGYRGIIAIHSTKLGPAVGGTRFWNYATEEDAITDALRLSRGMSYKAAAAGMPFGGGKSIIIGDNRTTNREALFRAHGRFVNSLNGRYITAEDVGTSTADMEYVRLETRHVGGLLSGGGDPSPWTALGVFRGIQAAAKQRLGSDDLAGKRVAIQGCGNVGYHLGQYLHEAGASLVVTDIDDQRIQRMVKELGAEAVASDAIYGVDADVFAPCALGAIINDSTIPMLKAKVVAGAANNQLLENRHGDKLHELGILYTPDYVINAGGIISGGVDFLGWSQDEMRSRVMAIYDTLLGVFAISEKEGIPSYLAADRLAENRLKGGTESPLTKRSDNASAS